MKDRIREIRKRAGLTQAEFGAKIGVKQNTIATYEMGRNTPTDTVITLICRVFDVSETWLRTGSGEMFQTKSRAEELGALTDSLFRERPGSFRSAVVTTLLRFDPGGPEWEVLERIYRGIAAELTAEEPPDTEK
ncbi:MAG: helix-turn-helix transcriptional regulator [Oscillospiraceae bacterium]|nr:helix-turn-helix transcriptional regulator [Oscillospiraceae bacterium]